MAFVALRRAGREDGRDSAPREQRGHPFAVARADVGQRQRRYHHDGHVLAKRLFFGGGLVQLAFKPFELCGARLSVRLRRFLAARTSSCRARSRGSVPAVLIGVEGVVAMGVAIRRRRFRRTPGRCSRPPARTQRAEVIQRTLLPMSPPLRSRAAPALRAWGHPRAARAVPECARGRGLRGGIRPRACRLPRLQRPARRAAPPSCRSGPAAAFRFTSGCAPTVAAHDSKHTGLEKKANETVFGSADRLGALEVSDGGVAEPPAS